MPAIKRLSLLAGLSVLAIVWLGPLLAEWRNSFAAGMTAHMAVIAVAAPLIAIGLPEPWRPGIVVPASFPLIASLAELLSVWGWHAPGARSLAEGSVTGTALEQATFLIVGVTLWKTSFASPLSRAQAAVGSGALLLTSIHMTLLGALLALSPRALYGSDYVTCFGVVLSPVYDQQIGGTIMLTIGGAVYLTGGVYLASRLLTNKSRS